MVVDVFGTHQIVQGIAESLKHGVGQVLSGKEGFHLVGTQTTGRQVWPFVDGRWGPHEIQNAACGGVIANSKLSFMNILPLGGCSLVPVFVLFCCQPLTRGPS